MILGRGFSSPKGPLLDYLTWVRKLETLPTERCVFTRLISYEADLLCGFCFPVHPFIMHLLNEFQIALSQLVPNAWRMIMSCMSIWMSACDGEMITLNEFFFCTV